MIERRIVIVERPDGWRAVEVYEWEEPDCPPSLPLPPETDGEDLRPREVIVLCLLLVCLLVLWSL